MLLYVCMLASAVTYKRIAPRQRMLLHNDTQSLSIESRFNKTSDDGCGNADVNTNASRKRKKPGAGRLHDKLQHNDIYNIIKFINNIYLFYKQNKK